MNLLEIGGGINTSIQTQIDKIVTLPDFPISAALTGLFLLSDLLMEASALYGAF